MAVAKDLRQKRAKLVSDARAIMDAGGDNPGAEIIARFEAIMSEADTMLAQIERLERVESMESQLSAALGVPQTGPSAPSPEEFSAFRDQRIALASVAGRLESLDAADRERHRAHVGRDVRILRAYFAGRMGTLDAADSQHFNARFNASGSVGTNSAGGFTVAPLFQREVLIAAKAWGGMRQASRLIQTDTGASLPWPTMDDTGQTAVIVGENSAVGAGTDLAFGSVSVGAFMYSTQALTVSLQLLQDSAFDFGALLRDAMAIRFGRAHNAHFTTGTGSGQPSGVITGAVLGRTGTTGQTTSILFDDLIKLEHSVDPAYRAGAVFMMHDSTLRVIKELKDTTGRYLWMPGATTGAPDTILGYPYIINQDMPTMAANAKSVLFGNFNNYLIRDVLDLQVLVLRERYADLLQVGYLGFRRTDGKLISAASPIKWYANSAT